MTASPLWVSQAFLIDENADFRLKRDLRTAGFMGQHVHASDVGLGGMPDSVVFSYAKAHQLVLLTSDQDFLQRSLYPPPHHGIVVVRLGNAQTFRGDVIAGIQTIASQTPDIADRVYTIEPGGVVQQITQ